MALRAFVAVFCTLSMVACGGGGTPASPSTPPPVNTPPPISVSGNWHFTATPGGGHFIGVGHMIGGMISNGVNVTAVMYILNSNCFDGSVSITFNGTVNGTNFSATSAPQAGQTITLNVTLAANGSSFSGTYSITGGCAAGNQGTLQGLRIPPVTGNWTGSIKSADTSEEFEFAATITQASVPVNGLFDVSGTVTLQGPCLVGDGTIDGEMASRFAYVRITNQLGDRLDILFEFNEAANAAELLYEFLAGVCAGDVGDGSMTRN